MKPVQANIRLLGPDMIRQKSKNVYLATLNIIRVHRSSDALGASFNLCYIKICDNEASYAVLCSVGERKKLAAKKCEGSMKYILSHRDDYVPT